MYPKTQIVKRECTQNILKTEPLHSIYADHVIGFERLTFLFEVSSQSMANTAISTAIERSRESEWSSQSRWGSLVTQ